RKESATLTKNNIRLKAIGDIESLPEACRKELSEAIALTESNNRMTLVLALSYSGRWDIAQAMKAIGQDLAKGELELKDIREETISKYLSTRDIPDPELLIRTSGEQRISNFLLWQLAYSELYITDLLWPDFRRQHFYEALLSYQRRERRFGKISEQLTK
ncbi:MAG: pyrophosphate synthase, partial [Adhaeribacter sp.]|nr:pyrophosphate synthase [Adhaeribacter sp.]